MCRVNAQGCKMPAGGVYIFYYECTVHNSQFSGRIYFYSQKKYWSIKKKWRDRNPRSEGTNLEWLLPYCWCHVTWEKNCKDYQMRLHHFKLIFMNLRKPHIKMYALLESCSFVSYPVFSTFLEYQLQSTPLWISVLYCLNWRQDFSPEMLDSDILGSYCLWVMTVIGDEAAS